MYHRRMDRRTEYRQEKSLRIEVAAILILALGLFTLSALATYHPQDPSWLNNFHGPALNACGKAGAFIASIFLHGIGLGAFLVPAALLFIAAHIHHREGSTRTLVTALGMSIATLSLTVFLALQWKYWPYSGNLLLTGGILGTWLAAALRGSFNSVGSSIVALSVFFIALVASTPVSVARILGRSIQVVARLAIALIRAAAVSLFYAISFAAIRLARGSLELLKSGLDRAITKLQQSLRARREARLQAKNETAASVPSVVPIEAFEPGVELSVESEMIPSGFLAANQVTAEPILFADSPAPEVIAPITAPPVPPLKTKFKPLQAPRGPWKLPTIEFLRKAPKVESIIDRDRLTQSSRILQQKFLDFGIEGEVTAVRPGPVITLYEFRPGPGVKVSRIAALADDLSMALSAKSVRILAPLPGTSVVGIEIPSENRQKVFLREFLQHPDFYTDRHQIPVVMGKDIGGQTLLSDLGRMPHLLCAGQTGSGKSVFMNSLICSLLYRFTPDELRMILVDPKFIEFRSYQDIPHLLLPVVDDAKHASIALKWAVREMERRYRILAMMGVRNLQSYNSKVQEMGADVVHDLLFAEENQSEGQSQRLGSDWIEAFELDEGGTPKVGKLPYIVIIIDELADLMMISKKEVEISIARIAQKARAAGIHLVLATQRPSTDVITGLIKANLPARVSFQLASYIDSKTILDRAGAERLLGQGDMLFIPPGVSQVVRLHGAFVDDEEINKITAFIKSQGKPDYREEILVDDEEDESLDGETEGSDELFEEAVDLVKRSGHASASFLQRHLKVGYNRAARMIETMESRGIVGPADGSRPREVLLR